MSQPNIPNITPAISLSKEDALNLLLASIAMEEMGLAHILNAEGEKIQYVLGTLPGISTNSPSMEDILKINESVKDTLEMVARQEYLLQSKLQKIIDLL
ncbi:hypothetical protein [Bacillus sp. 1P06AnD]|uniref:hypothetical protein n=1 Tax=Bacillus sp. 1P06AnD TaxID=3132208 RepID=UPI0039A055E6